MTAKLIFSRSIADCLLGYKFKQGIIAYIDTVFYSDELVFDKDCGRFRESSTLPARSTTLFTRILR